MASIDHSKYVQEEEKQKKWWARYFHPIVGRVWYSLLYLFATGATFTVIVGCWSPATEKFSLSRTDTSPMISYLANATGFNETQFQHPDLPDSWSWGFSGTCEVYTDLSKDTKCYHAFPPLFTIQDLVEKALGSSKEPGTAETISTWNTALAAKPSDPAYSSLAKLNSQRSHSVALLRGAAVAIFFSLLISFHNCFSSIALFFLSMEKKQERRCRHILFGIAIFDSLLYAGAIASFCFAMANPVAISFDGSEGGFYESLGDVAFIVMLVALQLKIMSIPIIGFIVLFLLGLELVLLVLVGYVIMKFLGKLVENNDAL